MGGPRLTLRFKLTFLYLAVFGVILAGLSAVLLTARERYVREDFDERLIIRANSMVAAIEYVEEGSGDGRAGANEARLIPFRLPGYFFQLRRADGTVVERSEDLGIATLPWDAAAVLGLPKGQPVLETLQGGIAAELLGPGASLRLLTIEHQAANGSRFYLQVAVNMAVLNASVGALRQLFLAVIPAGLLVAGIASYFLARRSLSPIGQIAREARALTAAHLERRLAVPPGHDEVVDMVITINAMLDRLEAAFRAQERFIANAAHELKTPAAILLGQAQVLAQQARTPAEYKAFLASVQEEMRRIGQIVGSFLTLARADAGLPLVSATEVSINDAVTDAVQRCQPLAVECDVRLIPQLALGEPDGEDLLVHGDAELLCSMIVNLVRNAVRHSPQRQVVQIQAEREGADVLVIVRDRGPGIPPQHWNQVFDPFFRVPNEEDTGQGTGLGLAISESVARMHKGGIAVRNRSGGGCEFTVRLPLHEAEASGH